MSKNGKSSGAAIIGRPTDCTPEYSERMANKLREVGCYETAAAQMPFSRKSHYEWMARGRSGEQPFRDYRDGCLRARAEHIEINLILPGTAAAHGLIEEVVTTRGEVVQLRKPGDLRFQMWFAERTHPDQYALKSKAFEFRSMIETMQSCGIEVTEKGALNLAAHVLGVDVEQLTLKDGGEIDTGDRRKNIVVEALRELRDGGD